MTGRFEPILCFAGCFLALNVASCASKPGASSVAAAVAEAKREGRIHVMLDVDAVEELDDTLENLAASYSFLTLSPTRAAVRTTATDTSLITWSTFRVNDTLSERSASPSDCPVTPPPDLRIREQEIFIPVLGGTTVIEGVTVTQPMSTRLPEDSTRTYVLFGVQCPKRVFRLPLGRMEFFEILPSGKLTYVGQQLAFGRKLQFQREIEALGTLDALRNYLRQRS